MIDIDTLQQFQNRIAEMEQRHEEELTKLKDDHDLLEARVRRSQGDKHTLGVETTQPQAVRWDNRSRRAFGRLLDTGERSIVP